MSQCKPKALFESLDIKVSTCTCCRRVGLQFKNLLFGFDRKDFEGFTECILHINFKSRAVNFPDGQTQVIVKTCHSDVQFCLSEKELQDLKLALDEAMLIAEIHSVLEETNE